MTLLELAPFVAVGLALGLFAGEAWVVKHGGLVTGRRCENSPLRQRTTKENAAKINLGQTVKDQITGFQGVVTGRVEYITGCHQLLVQPRVKENGDFVDSHWIDEDRAEPVDVPVLSLAVSNAGFDKPAPRR